MHVTADARDVLATATDLLVIPVLSVGDKKRPPGRLAGLDRLLGGGIQAAMASGDFRGERDQKLVLYPDGALPAKRVLLLGIGKDNRVDAEALRRVGGTAVREAAARKAKKVTVAAAPSRRLRAGAVGPALAEGAVLGNYRFDKYGARIKELPFFFVDRTRGQSKLSLGIAAEGLWIVWWLRIANALGRI